MPIKFKEMRILASWQDGGQRGCNASQIMDHLLVYPDLNTPCIKVDLASEAATQCARDWNEIWMASGYDMMMIERNKDKEYNYQYYISSDLL